MKNYDAVVFDMDGVIFDSERAVIECWLEIAKKYDIKNIEAACLECTGTTEKKTREIMLERYGQDFPYDSYKKESSVIFHEKYDNGRLPVKKGVKEILEYLKKNGKKVALASSTRNALVVQELTDAGFIDYFDKLVCGDMVNKSKPEPDIFLKACEELGVDPEKSFAIEDSFNGIRAAHAGNLRPIMVPDLKQPDEEIKELAEVVIEDLYKVIEYLDD
ncbi:MAG: HAD family phosphatase [Eubacterium sp.]|nr:HAD family phosphatase [Eubacterium sp.]